VFLGLKWFDYKAISAVYGGKITRDDLVVKNEAAKLRLL
jgi:hypothetical protein